jgi:predicted phage terminase large subunit-like protein
MLNPETVKLMKDSLVYFRHMTLATDDDCKSAYFHHDWSDMLLNGKDHVNMQAFRESAKSAIVLRAFPLHCCAFPDKRRDYIVIIKNNATLAKAKLKEISDELKSNPIISHNLVKIVEDNANVLSVDVLDENGETINIRIEAYGKGASIRGLSNKDRRPSIIIGDDLQDVEDARSDTVSEADWDWFLSDIVFLGKNCRIFIISNNLGEKCISERLMKADLQDIKFVKVIIPQVLDGEPTWKERGDTLESIYAERNDYLSLGKLDIWNREKLCIAVSPETRSFKEEDYRYYAWENRDMLLKQCSLFATLDPASSTKKTSCYRAIVINGVDKMNYWYILGGKYGRWGSDELINQIFNTVAEYSLRDFYIEKGQIQQILEPIIMQEQRIRNIFFNLKELEHAKEGNKLDRINILQPRFKSHSIFFPPDSKAPWLTELKSELAGVTKDAILSEYIDFVDALAMQNQIAKAPIGRAGVVRPVRANVSIRI